MSKCHLRTQIATPLWNTQKVGVSPSIYSVRWIPHWNGKNIRFSSPLAASIRVLILGRQRAKKIQWYIGHWLWPYKNLAATLQINQLHLITADTLEKKESVKKVLNCWRKNIILSIRSYVPAILHLSEICKRSKEKKMKWYLIFAEMMFRLCLLLDLIFEAKFEASLTLLTFDGWRRWGCYR